MEIEELKKMISEASHLKDAFTGESYVIDDSKKNALISTDILNISPSDVKEMTYDEHRQLLQTGDGYNFQLVNANVVLPNKGEMVIIEQYQLAECYNCSGIMIDKHPHSEQPFFTTKVTEELELIDEDGDMFWGCPVCKTDKYLMDYTGEDDE